ncbi:MAG: alpha-ketoglutarate-dependent dioxygenase AlkB [Gammaproteobacteria bacterium]|nr:alpha-ketoglutarate-dependent dioxygenase AlkB [Gammaproteobacteria bacterium]
MQAKPATIADRTTDPIYTYIAGYLGAVEADRLFDWLLANVVWRSERIKLFGRDIEVPRRVAWYGDEGVRYRYSGIDHIALGWPKYLADLVGSVRAEIAPGTNFVLLNRYRHGADSMGWHTDDEPGVAGPVVSISLGAQRRFHLRPAGNGSTIRLDLANGSLLSHPSQCPHAVPKTRKFVGERISLSFRSLAP